MDARQNESEKMKAKKLKLWAVADCETDSFDGQEVRPFVWAFVDSDGDRDIFWNTADFVEWLRCFDGLVYAHNGGKFDWMMPEIIAELENGSIKIINGRLASAKVGTATLRDSWLCLPAALEKFGEKDTFDYSILARERAGSRRTHHKAIEKYIMQDCVALYNAMERFIAAHGFALTQAGAALKTWEEMGGETRRYCKTHDARFRPYYFGGRCEVFECGAPLAGDFELYDINSSYPAAMTREHCAGTDYYTATNYKTAHPSSFWKIIAISRGALPVRDGIKTSYPDDDTPREYFTTGWEIQAALEFGKLEVIEAVGLIPRRFETFKPYVDKFFAERKAAKEAGDIIGDVLAKIFLNSLYGKFAANPENYEDFQIVEAGARLDGWTLKIELPSADILSRKSQRPQYFDVAVGASITGCARAALMRGIFSSSRVMYCDTDSVLCETFGGARGDKLGEWKKEAEIKRAWIAGKKTYALELKDGTFKTAHKGVSKLDTTVQDVIRAAKGEVVTIHKSAPCCGIDGKQKFFARRIRKT